MHILKAFIVALTLSTLVACSDSDDNSTVYLNSVSDAELNDAKSYFDQQLVTILDDAKKVSDPFDAYSLLVRAYYGADKDYKRISYKIPNKELTINQSKFMLKEYEYNVRLPHRYEAMNALFSYLDASLATGNKKAFLELYESKKNYDGEDLSKFEALQLKYSKTFATLAESLKVGETIDDDLIMLYAYQLKKGFVYPKNADKSVEYYQKLYASNPTVALYIMGVYLEINDFENAYFWKVRCIGTCSNMFNSLNNDVIKNTNSRNEGTIDLFRNKLTSVQFKEIEAAANDPARTSFK